MPRRAVATQELEPGKTTLRTILQTVIGVVIAAGVVLPLVAVIVQEELGAWLPENWVAAVVTFAAASAAVSAAITRIMAIPAVNDALRRVGLGAGSGPDVHGGAR